MLCPSQGFKIIRRVIESVQVSMMNDSSLWNRTMTRLPHHDSARSPHIGLSSLDEGARMTVFVRSNSHGSNRASQVLGMPLLKFGSWREVDTSLSTAPWRVSFCKGVCWRQSPPQFISFHPCSWHHGEPSGRGPDTAAFVGAKPCCVCPVGFHQEYCSADFASPFNPLCSGGDLTLVATKPTCRFSGHEWPFAVFAVNGIHAASIHPCSAVVNGVGTTGVAAKLLGRKCLMIEIEERYCKVAAARLRQNVLNWEDQR